jgi:hypothetical protein
MDDMQPEITISFGNKYWTLNGKIHRTDGPAIEYADGSKEWWIDDQIHRTDGPAIEFGGGICWYLNGEELTFDDWLDQHPDMTDEEKIMYKLEYG